jgi:two-component system chemotaxis response regulator CheB
VRGAGGLVVVQNLDEALVADLPRAGLTVAGADYVLPVPEIAELLVRLQQQPLPHRGGSNMTDPLEQMPETVSHDMTAQEDGSRRGQLSVFTCPECGGAMWQVDEHQLTRFRCHVGHAFYAESLLEEQSKALEAALWTATRTFREKSVLSRQVAAQERSRGNTKSAERFEEEAAVAEQYSDVIRQLLLQGMSRPPLPPAGGGEAGPLTEAGPNGPEEK